MNQQKIIEETANYVKEKLEKDTTGHDWWHTLRVWKMAKYISEKEGANTFIVELAALLHDIADWKFHEGDDSAGPKIAKQLLEKVNLDKVSINEICEIVANVSFKGEKHKEVMKTIEGKIVQDADRLDAIGAIGIARVFAFGAHLGNAIHDPNMKPIKNKTVEEYKKMDETSINHFYEKLLLLKDRMNTKTAKQIAEGRHKFMEDFLYRFFKEWDGKL
jgi:uncharacterized protein